MTAVNASEPPGRGFLLLALGVLAVALSACDGTAEGEDPGTPVPGETAIERDGNLAGELDVAPLEVEPGETIRMAVENHGAMRIAYDVGTAVERYVDGRWVRAVPHGFVPDIYLTADPGERAGPRYPSLVDLKELPDDLEGGIYRATKTVSPAKRPRSRGLALHATFEVRPPS